MGMAQTAREYIATLCYGNLYERLAAAASVPDAAVAAATEWNDFVVILHTLASQAVQPLDLPSVEPRVLQRRILAEFAAHPSLRTDNALVADIVSRTNLAGLEALVTVDAFDEAVRQARYIDRVRHDLGELTETLSYGTLPTGLPRS